MLQIENRVFEIYKKTYPTKEDNGYYYIYCLESDFDFLHNSKHVKFIGHESISPQHGKLIAQIEILK